MGEHFVLLVDRLITESTLEAVIESRNRSMMQAASSEIDTVKIDQSFQKIDFKSISSSPPGKLAECRICQDEDEDSNMETPCSCCGSLKYAHRGCVQRWCNEKGDTVCEICHQQFKPGYTAPPPLFQFGRIPMDFRGNWEIARRDSPQIIAMVSTDREFLDPDYEASTARNVFCCRTVAFIFMILLILRHTLPLIIGGNEEYSLPLVMLLILRTFGIVLPIYVLAMAVTAIRRRCSHHHHHQDLSSSSETSSDEESEPPILHPHEPQPLIIRVH